MWKDSTAETIGAELLKLAMNDVESTAYANGFWAGATWSLFMASLAGTALWLHMKNKETNKNETITEEI